MSEKQYGMLIRTSRCVGCQTCIVGCHVLHECPEDVYLGFLETVGCEDNYLVQGTFPDVRVTFRPHLCNHCEKPACVANCPTGAMSKREEDGIVETDSDVCIGCGTCVNSCPYEVPQIDEEAGVSSKCTLCFDRLDNDHRPWCVQACPAEARIVGDLNDPESEVAKYIAEKGAKPYLEENGTTPSVYYV